MGLEWVTLFGVLLAFAVGYGLGIHAGITEGRK